MLCRFLLKYVDIYKESPYHVITEDFDISVAVMEYTKKWNIVRNKTCLLGTLKFVLTYTFIAYLNT